MSGFLSKLNPVFEVVGKDGMTGGAVRSIPAIGSLQVGKRLRILGVLFALFF